MIRKNENEIGSRMTLQDTDPRGLVHNPWIIFAQDRHDFSDRRHLGIQWAQGDTDTCDGREINRRQPASDLIDSLPIVHSLAPVTCLTWKPIQYPFFEERVKDLLDKVGKSLPAGMVTT